MDRRLSLIEALQKLSDDPDVDELRTLHPLLTEARLIFGAEFDSAEYSFNQTLKTTVIPSSDTRHPKPCTAAGNDSAALQVSAAFLTLEPG